MKNTTKRISTHIIFWLAYLLFEVLIRSYYSQDFLLQLQLHLFYLPVKILATYFTLYFIIPQALKTKQYVKYVLIFLLTFFISGILFRLKIKYIVVPLYDPDSFEKYQIFTLGALIRIWSEYYIVIVASTIKIFKYWYESNKNEQILVRQKLESELNFLKGQIHPHFLFNTLNNLYVLTKKKSDIAPDVVMKLSDILSYILYECSTNSISLEKEIEILKSVISLEKLRHGDELIIEESFDIGENKNKFITPLLILPLIENAFKHGINTNIDEKYISIKSYLNDNYYYFEIINSYEKVETENRNTGIGLTNLKRRLELIYKNDYIFEISEKESKFKVLIGVPLYDKAF